MTNKPLTKQEKIELVKTVFGISFLIVGIRVAYILLTTGWDNTIQRWPVELGFLVLMIVLMSFTVIVGVYTDRYIKKTDTTENDIDAD